MGSDYVIEDDVEDNYVDFQSTVTVEQLPKDRWIKSVEFKGGSTAVHHIIARSLGGMSPGYDPVNYGVGYGTKLKFVAETSWDMHYHKEPVPGTGVWNRSKAGIVFWPKDTEIDHVISTESLGGFKFLIPAGAGHHAEQVTFTFPEDSLLVSFNPHMYLRGKFAKYTAIYPNGKKKSCLMFQSMILIGRPLIPAVHLGRPTTDEMMLGWMRYTSVAEHNIIADDEGTDQP